MRSIRPRKPLAVSWHLPAIKVNRKKRRKLTKRFMLPNLKNRRWIGIVLPGRHKAQISLILRRWKTSAMKNMTGVERKNNAHSILDALPAHMDSSRYILVGLSLFTRDM